MNPLILLGLGGTALVLAGKKKKTESNSERTFAATPAVTVLPKGIIKIPAKYVPDWSKKIASNGPKIAQYCHKVQGLESIDDVARCVAGDLFPTSGWPITNASQPWEKEAWEKIINITRAEFGLPPVQTQSIKIG